MVGTHTYGDWERRAGERGYHLRTKGARAGRVCGEKDTPVSAGGRSRTYVRKILEDD